MARATCPREKAAEPRESTMGKPVSKPGPLGGGSGRVLANIRACVCLPKCPGGGAGVCA